jgi:acyl-coenzyme A thioesterase PaaI-like protein
VIGARACAAALRGAWLDAEAALEELVAKGRIFEVPGPAMQFLVATYRALITAQRAPAEVDTARVASLLQLPPAGAADVRLLPSVCALAESAQQVGDAELCAKAEPMLRTAWERGVVLSAGWVFSLARVLGGCAAVAKRRAEAEDWYELALTQARAEGVRVEEARVLVDRARLRVERGDLDDAALARADLVEAEPLLRELALIPLAAEAERVAARLEL